jgi:outer membrane protein OmpA-like peptidoglycan-associated protein
MNTLTTIIALALFSPAHAADDSVDAVAIVDVTTDGAYDGDVQWVARDREASKKLLMDFAEPIEKGTLSLQLDEDGAFLTFTDPVLFDHDSYKLDRADKRQLRKAARVLEEHPGVQVAIVGHGDEFGMALPEMRAYAVRDFLQERGVSEAQLLPVGMGVNQHIDPDEADAASINRRVELRLLPELDPTVLGMNRLGEAD